MFICSLMKMIETAHLIHRSLSCSFLGSLKSLSLIYTKRGQLSPPCHDALLLYSSQPVHMRKQQQMARCLDP